jgi:two-component system, NarL family, sensor histidine kinase UhpB
MGLPLRVLLVEDSEDDALLLMRMLRRGGYDPALERVDTAAAMEAALDGHSWDLVISDHSMPAFSSSAALGLLRRKGFVDLPFIIVSGQIGEDAAVAAMKAGAHDYLMKDNLARLNSAIERELREADVRRERRQAEEKYRSIFENAIEGIFQTTVDGRFLTANPAMARMLGYESPEELLGSISNIRDQLYVEPGRREEFYRLALRDGFVSGFEVQMHSKDGNPVWVSANARAIYNAGGDISGYEGTVENITERKRAEKALREIREAERRRIARELHDVVLQDLTYALQSMQVLRRMPEGVDRAGETEHQVEALKRAVGGLHDAIYDLRLESVRERPLVRAVESIVELNRQIGEGCQFKLVVEEEFPAAISGPAGVEMGRVVQEALANVRRHAGARHAVVTLGMVDDELLVEIEDDGRGFGPETSYGMGLTGMRERVLDLGGELGVEGREGVGTRVFLRVRLGVLTGGEAGEPSNT